MIATKRVFLWTIPSSFVYTAEGFYWGLLADFVSFVLTSLINPPPSSETGALRSILFLVLTFLNSGFGLRNDVADCLIFFLSLFVF